MKLRHALIITSVAVVAVVSGSAQQPSTFDALQTYANTEKRVTELDWNLLLFNLLWHESYGSADYVKSSPVFFDNETMTFKAHLRVANKRDFKDTEPFLSLTPIRQRAELQGVVDHLVGLLEKYFPKVDGMQKRVQVTFVYLQDGGGSTTVATYQDGRLNLASK